MKRLLAVALALVMVLSLAAGCGKKEEPTAAPTEAGTIAPFTQAPASDPATEAPATDAPTEAPTEAPTTEIPTTEAPTEPPTEAPTEPPLPDMTAQETLDAALTNLEAVFRSLGDETKARQATLNGSANVGLTMSIAMGEQKMDLPVKASGTVGGELDSAKGAHGVVAYEADLGMLGSLIGIGGEGSEQAENEPLKGTLEAYLDFVLMKAFSCENGEDWYYSTIDGLEFPEDTHLAGQLNLDDMFEHYDFGLLGDHYVIEGDVKTQIPEDAEAMLPEGLGEITGMLADLKATARITISRDLDLTGILLEVGEAQIELSGEMEGFAAKIDGIKVELNLEWGEGAYELPKEVEENAKEKKDEYAAPSGETFPWEGTTFPLKDEVLADQKEFAAAVTGVEVSEYGEIVVNFAVQNKTDKDLTFQLDEVTVDGFMIPTYCSEDVDAKDEETFSMEIFPTQLTESGIESIDEIGFVLIVREEDDYFSDGIMHDPFTIYPTGLDAKTVVYPERPTSEDEVILLDEEDVTAVFVGFLDKDFLGKCPLFFFENRSDKALTFRFENVKVNGQEIEDPYWTVDLPAGSRICVSEIIYPSTLEKLNIEAVESIGAVLNVKDAENYFSEDALYTAEVLCEVK